MLEVMQVMFDIMHVHCRQVLASQLPFLANKNAELAVPPLLWPVNCIKIGGHVTLLSGPTDYSLYCALVVAVFDFTVVCCLFSKIICVKTTLV